MGFEKKATPFTQPSYDRPLAISRYWNPQTTGERVGGSFIGTNVEDGDMGPSAMLGIKRAGSGLEVVIRITAFVDAELQRLKPKIGQGIVATYHGTDVGGVRGKKITLELNPELDEKHNELPF